MKLSLHFLSLALLAVVALSCNEPGTAPTTVDEQVELEDTP